MDIMHLKDWALLAWIGLMSWLGQRQIVRLDRVELLAQNCIQRCEYDAAMSALRSEIRADHRDTQQRLDRVLALLLRQQQEMEP